MIDKNMIGEKIDEFEFPVERGKIREFAKAVLNPQPVYLDRQAAKEMGFQDVLVPVTFAGTFAHHVTSEDAVMDGMKKLGMDPALSVHGEVEFFHYRPVCAGEILQCELVIGNIYEKPGSQGGAMTFVEMDANFSDAQGNPAMKIRNLFIQKS